MGTNADIVKGLYEAFAEGDVPAVLAAFDPRIEWREAESSPYGDRNPYVGPAAVAEGVFQRFVSDVDEADVAPRGYHEAGDTVVVEGRYRGKVKATGEPLDSQFAHVWHLRDGRVVRFQQYTDTLRWARALAP